MKAPQPLETWAERLRAHNNLRIMIPKIYTENEPSKEFHADQYCLSVNKKRRIAWLRKGGKP